MSGIFPRTDPGFAAWSLNYKTLLVATPSAFGISTPQATAYGVLHDAYATALAACEPSIRTKSAVVSKNAAKKAAMTNASFLANIVYGTSTVTNAQRTQLGLPLKHSPIPSPIPSAPGLDVISVDGWTVKLKIHDSASSNRRGKPFGAQGAAIFSHVGTSAPTELSDWHFEGNTGRTTAEVVLPSTVVPGSKVFFTAFWFNGRKQSSVMASPVSTNVQGGAVTQAA